jgi:hypothetical protein
MSNVYFYFCAQCANYLSNDEIEDMPIMQETAMFSGAGVLRSQYHLSMDKTLEGETWFTCECCKARCFSERQLYAGTKIQEGAPS